MAGSERGSVRKASVVAALVAAIALIAPAGPAAASHERRAELERLIRQKRAQIADAARREASLQERIQASDARRAALNRQIGVIQGRLYGARVELAVIEKRLVRVDGAIRAKTSQLEQTLADLDHHTSILNQRAASLYMMSPADAALSFGSMTSLGDIVDAAEYGASVVRSDQHLVETIETTRARIEEQRAELEEARKQVNADRKAALRQAEKIARAHSDLASTRNQISAEIAHRATLLEQVRREKAAYQRALDNYIRESRAIEAMLRARQNGQVIQGVGGWLKWPTSGRISSGYGWRTHPIHRTRSFHTGIDIAAPSGTSVKAARRGTVVFAGWHGSAYGNVVIIDHGNRIATVYAHLLTGSFRVRSGQRVSTLQQVASVGSTGWSTGPHLHFEVRSNGQHTNPMNWL